MRLLFILVVIAIFQNCLSIDTPCQGSSNCPTNATCSAQNYCQCIYPYVLDCSTAADYLTNQFQNITLTNQSTYFQSYNQQPNVYYQATFQVCCQNNTLTNYDLNYSVWLNTGTNDLSTAEFIGTASVNLADLVEVQQCIDFVQFPIKFETQLNGQIENLLIRLFIQPQASNFQVDNATATIKMNINFKQVASSAILITISIVLLSVTSFVIICVVVYCCYRRWKAKQLQIQNKTYKQRLVEQFKKNTPQYDAKQLSIPAMTTCSICLGEFQSPQKVRKTVCRHLFHSQCIQSWCLKNLSCPVCRLDLDEQTINKKKKQLQMSDFKWRQNSLSQSARQHLMLPINQRQQQ